MEFSNSPRLGKNWAWVLVLSALCCFGASYLASYYRQVLGEEGQPGTAQVQGLVRQATATARYEAGRLLALSHTNRSLSFSKLLSQSVYPAFLF